MLSAVIFLLIPYDVQILLYLCLVVNAKVLSYVGNSRVGRAEKHLITH